MKYRQIKKYKYELVEDYIHALPDVDPTISGKSRYLTLENSTLVIHEGYTWDGCSGPTIDTPNNMRAGMVHDSLYQLMRMGILPQDYKDMADCFLRDLIIEDGGSTTTANIFYHAVRYIGGMFSKKQPRVEPVIEIIDSYKRSETCTKH